jgi:A/G-specific adenine glycosylase
MPGSRFLAGRLTRENDVTGVTPAQVTQLQDELLRWYSVSHRDLPWRRTRDPWAIWVSEIMLQQTRVDTVKPYFQRFIDRFPSPLALAEAPEDEVLAAWSGLGYYRRARMLHAASRVVAEQKMPSDRDGLLGLPGIGRYTAGAIASIAFGESVGLVDGNVARVLSRLFVIEDDMKRAGMKRAEALADRLVPAGDRGRDPGQFNQALMELGATICTPRAPACDRCPVANLCGARAERRVHELPVLGAKTKPKPQRVQALVATKDGQILLARRRSSGLFGGLWEPPSIDGGPRAKDELFAFFQLASVERAGRVTHVLSHRRLTVDVHVGVLARKPSTRLPEVYETADLFDSAALATDIGLATLARKVLAAAMPKSQAEKTQK